RAVERAAHLAPSALHAHDPRAPKPPQVPRHEGLADPEAPRELRDRVLRLGHEDLHDAQAVYVPECSVIAPQLAQARLAEDGGALAHVRRLNARLCGSKGTIPAP